MLTKLMKADGLKGESQLENHQDEAELEEVSVNIFASGHVPGDVATGREGKPHVSPVVIRKHPDSTGAWLQKKALTAEVIPSVTITLVKRDNNAMVSVKKYVLKNARIASTQDLMVGTEQEVYCISCEELEITSFNARGQAANTLRHNLLTGKTE